MNCRFFTATSNTVERLFSSARWILTDLQKRISSILFEAFLFFEDQPFSLRPTSSAESTNVPSVRE